MKFSVNTWLMTRYNPLKIYTDGVSSYRWRSRLYDFYRDHHYRISKGYSSSRAKPYLWHFPNSCKSFNNYCKFQNKICRFPSNIVQVGNKRFLRPLCLMKSTSSGCPVWELTRKILFHSMHVLNININTITLHNLCVVSTVNVYLGSISWTRVDN